MDKSTSYDWNFNISKGVIESLSKIAVSEVDGICAIQKTEVYGDLFQKNTRLKRGIDMIIDLYLDVSSDCNINNAAVKVQRKIISAVEQTTGIQPEYVNIYINDIIYHV